MNAEHNEQALDAAMMANADAYHNSVDNWIDGQISAQENTPSDAPWGYELVDQQLDEFGDVEWHQVYDKDGMCIAQALRAADARLIQAAPELFDRLENLLIGIGMGWDLDGLVETAQAAIDKARNGKPTPQ